MIIRPFLTTSLRHFSLKGWENILYFLNLGVNGLIDGHHRQRGGLGAVNTQQNDIVKRGVILGAHLHTEACHHSRLPRLWLASLLTDASRAGPPRRPYSGLAEPPIKRETETQSTNDATSGW